MAKAAFIRKGELLRGNITKDLKKRMVKALVWSVALYGSETWTLRKEDIQRIQAFEMWIWRKMEKISWTAHVSNEEVLFLVQEQRSLMQVIKQRQANWIGHVLRHDCLLKTVLEGKMERKRSRGKPRRKMLDLLVEQEDKKISYEELKRGAQSRVGWPIVIGTCLRAEHAKKKKFSVECCCCITLLLPSSAVAIFYYTYDVRN